MIPTDDTAKRFEAVVTALGLPATATIDDAVQAFDALVAELDTAAETEAEALARLTPRERSAVASKRGVTALGFLAAKKKLGLRPARRGR